MKFFQPKSVKSEKESERERERARARERERGIRYSRRENEDVKRYYFEGEMKIGRIVELPSCPMFPDFRMNYFI